MPVMFGYACISLVMKEVHGVFTNRTMVLATLHKKGVSYAQELARANAEDLLKILEYNEQNGLRFFRLTSSLCPHLGNPEGLHYDISCVQDQLARAGAYAREHGHRITCHPGQFAQLGSPREEVVQRTFQDLEMHASIFRAMGLDVSHGAVMIVHGGGAFGDKPGTLARWAQNYQRLPEWVRKFVVLENDEWTYSVDDLLPMCEQNQIPLCIDFFHHQVGHATQFDVFAGDRIARCMNIWRARGIKPKCHWSNQAPGVRKGTHADCVSDIPENMLAVCREHDMDIMLETKNKDLCTLGMLEKYCDKHITEGRVDWRLRNA